MLVDVAALRRIPLFAALNEEDLALVPALVVERRYERGDIILLEGDSDGGLCYVQSGLVSATLWFGNAAAALRVGSILLAPLFPGTRGYALDTFLFSLSGPFGLALAMCLAINLWPLLRTRP